MALAVDALVVDGFVTKQGGTSAPRRLPDGRGAAVDGARCSGCAATARWTRSSSRRRRSHDVAFEPADEVRLIVDRPAVARRGVAPRHPAARAPAAARERPGRIGPRPGRGLRPAADRHLGRLVARAGLRAALTFRAANSRYRPGERDTREWVSRAGCPAAERWYGAPVPETALTPAIRDEIERLGQADIMVGIPSFKNAATIGYVVRAAQAGLVQYFPDLHPVLVNSDAGSPDGTGRVVVETEPPDYIEQILLVRPTNRLERVSLTYPEIDGVGGKGAALRTIFEIAAALEVQALVVVDSDLRSIVPEWIELLAGPDPQGRLRLRGAALRPLQVRRHDHQHGHLPADPGALRPPHPPADRRRLRRRRRPRPALPRARRLDAGHQPLRHRHLDDDVRADRRVRRLPDAARGQDPRPQGPGLRPRADVPPGRRHDPAAGQPLPRALAGDPAAATTSRPTASSGSSSRRRSR